tara:strand:+ start:866 stop:1225 length:360 start_codon:yes stop_codon:yes gene_type:complete
MLKKIVLIGLCLTLGLSFQSNAQKIEKKNAKHNSDTLELELIFEGANFFVQNPKIENKKNGFAIKQILTDEGEVIPFENQSVIEINLIKKNLQDGDLVVLKVIYSGTKKPKLITANATE